MSFLVGAKKLFNDQRYGAKRRGVEWAMTFEEWLQFWMASGKYDERGIGLQRFCMARHGDKGPYKIGNVKICTNEQNCGEKRGRITIFKGPMAIPWQQKMKKQREARDRRIRELWRSKVSAVEIARRHGISRIRVYQILANGK